MDELLENFKLSLSYLKYLGVATCFMTNKQFIGAFLYSLFVLFFTLMEASTYIVPTTNVITVNEIAVSISAFECFIFIN